jgi:hypothetical protein
MICSSSFVNLGLLMRLPTTYVCHATTIVVEVQQFFDVSFRSRNWRTRTVPPC